MYLSQTISIYPAEFLTRIAENDTAITAPADLRVSLSLVRKKEEPKIGFRTLSESSQCKRNTENRIDSQGAIGRRKFYR